MSVNSCTVHVCLKIKNSAQLELECVRPSRIRFACDPIGVFLTGLIKMESVRSRASGEDAIRQRNALVSGIEARDFILRPKGGFTKAAGHGENISEAEIAKPRVAAGARLFLVVSHSFRTLLGQRFWLNRCGSSCRAAGAILGEVDSVERVEFSFFNSALR